MKNKILQRCLFGAPAGLALQIWITILASYRRGTGEFSFVSHWVLQIYGNELNAFTAQCVGAMLIGMIWAVSSLIYQETDWNLLKQTVVHFLVCMLPSLGICLWLHWLPRNWSGLLSNLLLFSGLYALNWIVQYHSMKKRIRQLNEKLNNLNGE